MRSKLTPAFAASARATPGSGRTTYWDAGMAGFGLMVTANGHRSYVVQYRAAGRRVVDEARSRPGQQNEGHRLFPGAETRSPRGAKRSAPIATPSRPSWKDLGPRGEPAARRSDAEAACRGRGMTPKLGDRQINDITRSDIIRLLDGVADKSGAPMADHVLAYLRRVMTWHASRSDDFRSPIVRGMARTRPSQRRRQRVLSDDELKAVWCAVEALQSAFGYLVRFLLLTATRRTEAAAMRRGEVVGDDWIIPQERYKTGLELVIPLSPAAQAVVGAVPRIGKSGLVFQPDGKRPLGGFSKFKRAFDVKVLAELRKEKPDAELPRWTLHDLRRTARSLMSRAGVPSGARRALPRSCPIRHPRHLRSS